jgi:hypothetical protein
VQIEWGTNCTKQSKDTDELADRLIMSAENCTRHVSGAGVSASDGGMNTSTVGTTNAIGTNTITTKGAKAEYCLLVDASLDPRDRVLERIRLLSRAAYATARMRWSSKCFKGYSALLTQDFRNVRTRSYQFRISSVLRGDG